MTIERITIEPRFGNFRAYGWGTYRRGSVLDGQPFRQYICEEISVQHCREVIALQHPGVPVEVLGRATSSPDISLSHLPGEVDQADGDAPR